MEMMKRKNKVATVKMGKMKGLEGRRALSSKGCGGARQHS